MTRKNPKNKCFHDSLSNKFNYEQVRLAECKRKEPRNLCRHVHMSKLVIYVLDSSRALLIQYRNTARFSPES